MDAVQVAADFWVEEGRLMRACLPLSSLRPATWSIPKGKEGKLEEQFDLAAILHQEDSA